MGKLYEEITSDLADWLKQQRLFFVATAPLSAEGLINCSPKGLDSFRILGPRELAYLDLTGSGVETIAHLRENSRIVFTFCAFDGPPKIVRLHGMGDVVAAETKEFEKLRKHFPEYPGARAIIRVALVRISDSCGFGVPRYDYAGEREALIRWADSKGADGLRQYREEKNSQSIEGLQGLPAER